MSRSEHCRLQQFEIHLLRIQPGPDPVGKGDDPVDVTERVAVHDRDGEGGKQVVDGLFRNNFV